MNYLTSRLRFSGLLTQIGAAVLAFFAPLGAAPRGRQRQSNPQESRSMWFEARMPAASPTPLADLISEAERANPRIRAAQDAWQAAEQVPSQVSALPDPQFTVQQFSVGSPRPFAGFTNSNFAYIGFGVSENFPYPGKLRLRGEAARRGATADADRLEIIRRQVIQQLEADYYQLAYYSQTLGTLRRDEKLLEAVEKIAEARYRVGKGNQQDVLKAQLEQTELLRMIVHHHEHMGQLEAALKELLDRPPHSPDIAPEPLAETTLRFTPDQLLRRARSGNPEVAFQQELVRERSLQVDLARKDFYPDFNVQYMYQRTGLQFRPYYMLTFGVQVPLWRSRKQQPKLAEAAEALRSSERDYEAATQQAYSGIEQEYLAADAADKTLEVYRQGLIPQARASFEAALAAYEAGRVDFQSLLSSFLEILNLRLEYWQTLADHEIAIAKIQQLTGISLNPRTSGHSSARPAESPSPATPPSEGK